MGQYDTENNFCSGCIPLNVRDLTKEYENADQMRCISCIECCKNNSRNKLVFKFINDENKYDYYPEVLKALSSCKHENDHVGFQHSPVYGCFCICHSKDYFVPSPVPDYVRKEEPEPEMSM